MLRGVDISQWQNVGAGDGSDFVIIKATEGFGWTDQTCDQHYQRAKANGQLRGFYHFARPDLNDPLSEADYFVNECLGYFKDGIPVLDWEVNTWEVWWAKQWLDRVYERTGVRPLIYMSASVVNSYDWSCISGDYGLWIAGYPAEYDVPNPPVPPENYLPYSIGSWAFVVIWQYTSSAGRLDRDVAYIDAVAWSKYAGSYVAPKEEPKPVEQPKEEVKEEKVKEVVEPVVEVVIEQPEELLEPVEVEPAKKVDFEEYEKAMEELEKGAKMPFTLPTKVYEVGRWLLWLVIPAIMLFLGLLNTTLQFGWDMENINIIVDGACVLLGTILGIAKTTNDKE